mmetsp:Transcript_21023/g.43855  ORF Transcript_21023/g.43855 Transcript_21023/m.43855 type:complete len:226 (+) Transcript_21023:99-776(+)
MKRFAFLVTLSFCAEVDALVSQYQKNDILYKAGFLPLHTLNILQDEAKDLLSEMKAEKNSVAHSRVGCALRRGDVIYDICSSEPFRDRVRELTGFPDLTLALNVPVELRHYLKNSHGMDWHTDDVLFSGHRQTELVITLINESSMQTMWKEKNGKVTSVCTEEGSVIFVRAGGVEHAVRTVSRTMGVGRVIMKMVFVDEGVTELSEDGKKVLGQVPHRQRKRKKR